MNLGIFLRVSTLKQAKSDSVEIHEKRARLYAEAKGHQIIEVYNLAGVSGKSTINHSETQRMMDDIRDKKIDGILISSLSRLARNTIELLEYSEFFRKHNASMISLKESIDTSTSQGKFFFTLTSAFVTLERENNRDRIMASLETRKALGKFIGGTVSYGFKLVNAQIELNEDEAPIRRLMYELFIQQKRAGTVARILTEKGYRTRLGKKWSGTTIRRLLKNSDAKGIRKTNHRERWTKDNPNGLKPQSEWIIQKCPQIVDTELFDTCQAILLEQDKGKAYKPLNQRLHLFTRYIFCDKGHPMSVQSKTNKYSCVQCKIRIEREGLEKVFHSRLSKFIISEEEIQEFTQSSKKIIKAKKEELKLVKKKIEELKIKLDRVITLNIDGLLKDEAFKEHYEPIYEQKRKLSQSLTYLENEFEQMNLSQSSTKIVVEKSKDLYAKWFSLEKQEKRFIIEAITTRIVYDGKKLRFILKQIAPLSSLELNPNDKHNGII